MSLYVSVFIVLATEDLIEFLFKRPFFTSCIILINMIGETEEKLLAKHCALLQQ